MSDGLLLHPTWNVYKFKDKNRNIHEEIQNGDLKIWEAVEHYEKKYLGCHTNEGNAATTAGIKYLMWAMCGVITNVSAPTSTHQFTNALAYTVVGTGSGAAAQTDTYATFTSPTTAVMVSTYPSCSAATPWKLTFESSYAAGSGTGLWNEMGVGNTSVAATLFDRVVSSKGTKDAAETWVLDVVITFT